MARAVAPRMGEARPQQQESGQPKDRHEDDRRNELALPHDIQFRTRQR